MKTFLENDFNIKIDSQKRFTADECLLALSLPDDL